MASSTLTPPPGFEIADDPGKQPPAPPPGFQVVKKSGIPPPPPGFEIAPKQTDAPTGVPKFDSTKEQIALDGNFVSFDPKKSPIYAQMNRAQLDGVFPTLSAEFGLRSNTGDAAIDVPDIQLPKPSPEFNDKHPFTGAALGHLSDMVSGLTTPKNLSMLLGIAASPAFLQELAGIGFTGQQAYQTSSKFTQAALETDPTRRKQLAGEATADLVAAGVMGWGTVKGIKAKAVSDAGAVTPEGSVAIRSADTGILNSAAQDPTFPKQWKDVIQKELAKRQAQKPLHEILAPIIGDIEPESPAPQSEEALKTVAAEAAQPAPAQQPEAPAKPAEAPAPSVAQEKQIIKNPDGTPMTIGGDEVPPLRTAIQHEGGIALGENPIEEHAEIIKQAAGKGLDVTDGQKGFVDDQGQFINRIDAARIALDKGLIDQSTYDRAMARTGEDKGLHSEDLKTPVVPVQTQSDKKEEPNKAEQSPTGIRNSIVDRQRENMGLPERIAPLKRKFGSVWDQAMAIIDKNKDAGKDLVESLKKNMRPLTDTEDAILTHEQVTRQHDYDSAVEDVNNAKNDSERSEAEVRLANARDSVYDLYDVGTQAGTANARGLNARRLMVNEDYSLARMEARKRASTGGEPLTKEQTDAIKVEHDKLTDLQKQAADVEKQKNDVDAGHYFEQLLAEIKKDTQSAKGKGSKLTEFLDDQAAKARARIRSRGGRLMAGINPVELADHAIIGASYIAKGARVIGEWSAQMVKEFGEAIKPFLPDIFEKSKQFHDANAKQFVEKKPGDIKARAKAEAVAGEGISHKTVYDLARAHVNAGVTAFDDVMKAVHNDLKEAYPDATERDVKEAFTEYGKVKFPSAEADKVKLAELRQIGQLKLQIEDLEKGLPAKKTGQQRAKATQDIRDLTKKRNDLLQKNFPEPSPDQIASRDQAKQTAIQNRIDDIDKELKTGVSPTRAEPGPDSVKTEQLKAERDAMQEKLNEIKQAQNPPKSPAEKQIEQLSKVKQRLDEILSGKRDPSSPKPFTALSDAAGDIKAEIQAMHELVAQVERESNPPKTDEEKQITAIEKRSQELRDKIAAGDLSTKTGKPTVNTREVSAAKSELEKLNKQMADLRKAAKPETDPNAIKVKQQIKALKDAIAEYEKKVATKDFSTKPQPATRPDTKEVSDLREIRDARKAVYDAAKKASKPVLTPEEAQQARYEKAITKRIADLKAKIAAGDYTKTPPNKTVLNAKLLKLQSEAQRVKNKFDQGVTADMLAKRTATEKFIDTVPKISRFALLSNPLIFAKLTAASFWRMAFNPIEDLAGSVIGKAVPSLADKATMEGGFNAKALAKGYAGAFTKGITDAWKTLTTGQSDLDVLYGKKNAMPREWYDYLGSLHGAMKAPVARFAFENSMEKRMSSAIAHGVDVSDPMVQLSISQDAYKDSLASKFQQDNRAVKAYNAALRTLKAPDKVTGKTPLMARGAAAGAETMLPIVKIPTNIVAEAFQYAVGSISGSVKLAVAMRRGMENLKPEEANLIMRHLKKGSVGGALILAGFLAPNMIGGFYQAGKKRDEQDVQPGHIKINGEDIPPYLIHSPALESLQVGATMRRVADSKLRKKDEQTQGIGAGVMASLLGLTEEVPFAESSVDMAKMFNPMERAKFFGELIKSRVDPQAIQYIAKEMDKGSDRDPKTIWQDIEMGIPGLREKVPEKAAKKTGEKESDSFSMPSERKTNKAFQ